MSHDDPILSLFNLEGHNIQVTGQTVTRQSHGWRPLTIELRFC